MEYKISFEEERDEKNTICVLEFFQPRDIWYSTFARYWLKIILDWQTMQAVRLPWLNESVECGRSKMRVFHVALGIIIRFMATTPKIVRVNDFVIHDGFWLLPRFLSPRLNDEWLICWIDSVASIDAPSCVLIRRLFVCARHFDNASDWFTHMICVWTIGQFQEYVHQKSLTITSVQCEWVYLIYLLNDRWNKIFSFIIKKVK